MMGKNEAVNRNREWETLRYVCVHARMRVCVQETETERWQCVTGGSPTLTQAAYSSIALKKGKQKRYTHA